MDYSYNYDYGTSAGLSGGALAFIIIIALAVAILLIVAKWKIYEKAGKPGWGVFVPGWTNILNLEVAKMETWHVLIMLYVPLAALVYAIIIPIKTAKAFGKSTGFGVLTLFFPYIMYPILAFGSAEYEK